MFTPWNRSKREEKTPIAPTVAGRQATPEQLAMGTVPASGQASLLLYLAGLCVTLSGLYAVNFGLEDPMFARLTYGLVIAGYIFSYVVRVRRINLKSIQFPLFVCIALLVLANVSGSGMGWLVPKQVADDHPLALQLLVAWVAIIHSFALVNDASVLFACVPGMTMLAIVSTSTPETAVQNAFLVFVGAATFLMVHENYLRTRQESAPGRRPKRARNLFGGQLQLTATCLLGALMLANIVAVPIRTIGQTFIEPNTSNPLNGASARQRQMNMAAARIFEQNAIELAVGPTAESDAPLMRIQSERGLYWRGTTFSRYTGTSFENPLYDQEPLFGERDNSGSRVNQVRESVDPYGNPAFASRQVYHVPLSDYELPSQDMQHSQKTIQHVQVIGGVFSSLYGAAVWREVTTKLTYVRSNAAGALIANVLPGTSYDVTSQVAADDAVWLRQASSSLADVPPKIEKTYLQLPDANPGDCAKLQQLAMQLTQGKSNNYDKVQAMRAYIAEQCKYNLQSPRAPRDRDIVAWFLCDQREGYCDSFAAALTVLCRYAKIPARLASGFLPGDLEGDNSYLVRQKHKHVWTEVFFPHIGWVPFDATEGSVDISDHSQNVKTKRLSFMAWLTSHGVLPPLVGALLLGMLGYILKTEGLDRLRPRRSKAEGAVPRPQTNTEIIALYTQSAAVLARKGLPRLEHQTPDEYAVLVASRTGMTLPGLETELAQLTALYSRVRYGRDIATAADVQEAQRITALIRQSLRAARRSDLVSSG